MSEIICPNCKQTFTPIIDIYDDYSTIVECPICSTKITTNYHS